MSPLFLIDIIIIIIFLSIMQVWLVDDNTHVHYTQQGKEEHEGIDQGSPFKSDFGAPESNGS